MIFTLNQVKLTYHQGSAQQMSASSYFQRGVVSLQSTYILRADVIEFENRCLLYSNGLEALRLLF